MLLPLSEDDFYTVNDPNIAWVSGITAGVRDDVTGESVCVGTLEEQTSKAYENLEKVLARSGHTLNNVVKMIYYIDSAAVKSFNQAIGVRAELFGIDQLPAVTAVAVHSLLEKGALVKIEAVADRGGKKTVHYPDRRNDWKLPYKPCWDGGNVLWAAGLVARSYDNLGSPLWPSDILGQYEAIYKRAETMLGQAGLEFSDVVSLVDYIVPEGYHNYQQTHAIRRKYFGDQFPSSTTVLVDKLLADDALVEIDMFAVRHGDRMDLYPSSLSESMLPSGVRKGDLVFVGGQVATDSCGKDALTQVRQCLTQIRSVVQSAGGTISDIARIVVYISEDGYPAYQGILEEIKRYFIRGAPSVTCIGVNNLSDPHLCVEMNAVADLRVK